MSAESEARLNATREREANRKLTAEPTGSFDVDVVGVTFQPAYPGNMFELERLNFEAESMGERVPVVLIREPNNEFDKNCIAIHCPALGEGMGLLGKVPRALAARLAPMLDRGVILQGEVAYIRISQENLNQPGLTVNVTRRDP